MALHIDGDHFPRFGKLVDPIDPVARDRHERPVQQHHRLALAMDLVIHLQSVNRSIARNRFLLRRCDNVTEASSWKLQ